MAYAKTKILQVHVIPGNAADAGRLSGADPRAGRERQPRSLGDLADRIGVELRADFAQEPLAIAIGS